MLGHMKFLLNPKYINIMYKVRELEKVRFRKRMRPALYRNKSPLMRREGGSSQISELLN